MKLENKFLTQKTFDKFKNDVVTSKVKLYSLLQKIRGQNKTIFGVGAPSRAATLVNYVGLNEDIVQYILEIKGSYKIGKYMPGTNIPIVNEKIIKKQKPNYLLLLSWHISDMLIKALKKMDIKENLLFHCLFQK